MVKLCVELSSRDNELLERLKRETGLPKRALVKLIIRLVLRDYESGWVDPKALVTAFYQTLHEDMGV